MNISFDTLQISVNRSECIDLYSALLHNLERSIDEHWKNHPDAYEKNTAQERAMMRELGKFVGRDYAREEKDLQARLDNLVNPKGGGK